MGGGARRAGCIHAGLLLPRCRHASAPPRLPSALTRFATENRPSTACCNVVQRPMHDLPAGNRARRPVPAAAERAGAALCGRQPHGGGGRGGALPVRGQRGTDAVRRLSVAAAVEDRGCAQGRGAERPAACATACLCLCQYAMQVQRQGRLLGCAALLQGSATALRAVQGAWQPPPLLSDNVCENRGHARSRSQSSSPSSSPPTRGHRALRRLRALGGAHLALRAAGLPLGSSLGFRCSVSVAATAAAAAAARQFKGSRTPHCLPSGLPHLNAQP